MLHYFTSIRFPFASIHLRFKFTLFRSISKPSTDSDLFLKASNHLYCIFRLFTFDLLILASYSFVLIHIHFNSLSIIFYSYSDPFRTASNCLWPCVIYMTSRAPFIILHHYCAQTIRSVNFPYKYLAVVSNNREYSSPLR
jgi:hypothetical protein